MRIIAAAVAPMAAPAVAPAVSWRVESLWRMGDIVGCKSQWSRIDVFRIELWVSVEEK